jgi:Ni,Fe-hydrogenase maturation factor
MTRTLIIGIGNPLRGDDGLGWRAVEMLRREASINEAGPTHATFDTMTCHQLTPELAEEVARATRVIFIDACVGHPPGKIRVNRLTKVGAGLVTAQGVHEGRPYISQADGALTHHLDPAGLLKYSRELYGSWPEASTISMTGADFGYSESLSAPVESQLPALVNLVAQAALRAPAGSEEEIEVHSNG